MLNKKLITAYLKCLTPAFLTDRALEHGKYCQSFEGRISGRPTKVSILAGPNFDTFRADVFQLDDNGDPIRMASESRDCIGEAIDAAIAATLEARKEPTADPITVLQLADHRIGREARTGKDFAEAKLPMMGGCERCSASLSAANAYPSKTNFLRCGDCIGDLGYGSVEEANKELFGQ